jgi:hypothetical protein
MVTINPTSIEIHLSCRLYAPLNRSIESSNHVATLVLNLSTSVPASVRLDSKTSRIRLAGRFFTVFSMSWIPGKGFAGSRLAISASATLLLDK